MRVATRLLGALLLVLAEPPAARSDDPKWVGVPELRKPDSHDRQRIARQSLENARALRREQRHAAAEAVAGRGLHFAPDHPGLQRERARALEALGRPEEAARAHAAADRIDPPPAAPPDAPIDLASREVVLVLLPPDPDADADRRPSAWPNGEIAAVLEQRLQRRLPEARVVHAAFDTLEAARAWLSRSRPRAAVSLRVDRLVCGDTIKDGRFGMAWLRVAAERPGRQTGGPAWGRIVVDEPRLPGGCGPEVAARALEVVLVLPLLRETLQAAAGDLGADWSRETIRALFPGLGRRIEAELAAGSGQLRLGRIEAAAVAFGRAARIDPEDPVVKTYQREAEATLALSRELARRRESGEPGVLEPRLSAAQRRGLEAQLAEERQRREQLLAALAVLEEDARLPPACALAALEPVAIAEPEAFGPSLARRRAGGAVETRAAFAPDGSEIARYYFPVGEPLPVLREDDRDADEHADRWIAYAGDARGEVWEDGRNLGRPDVRLVFGGEGSRLLRVEIDRDGDRRPERVLHYAGDALRTEARDTDHDGRLETFDHFGPEGSLQLREEDLDGDGEIDSRSEYHDGGLVRRELSREALPTPESRTPR